MRWILIILIGFACFAGCATGRGSDSDYESEEQKLVGAIRLARTLDTDSTEVEDMIILKVYQLRAEDQNPRYDNYDEIESDISNCAVKDSAGRLKNSSTTKRIDTLLDKERFSQFVAKSYENCRQRILRAQIHKEEAKSKERKPNEQKNIPVGESSYYELIERYYDNKASDSLVSPEN